jgi:hypothetical protein
MISALNSLNVLTGKGCRSKYISSLCCTLYGKWPPADIFYRYTKKRRAKGHKLGLSLWPRAQQQ